MASIDRPGVIDGSALRIEIMPARALAPRRVPCGPRSTSTCDTSNRVAAMPMPLKSTSSIEESDGGIRRTLVLLTLADAPDLEEARPRGATSPS